MDAVLTLTVPGVFEDLTVLGNINDKQRRYREHIVDCGGAGDGDAVKGPRYFLSEFGEGKVRDDVTSAESGGWLPLDFTAADHCVDGVQALPVFFETRYLFRAKCCPEVKSVSVYHRMAAVTDGFTFTEGWLFGDIDFVNTPGRFTLALDVKFKDGTARRITFRFTVVSVKMDVEGDYRAILKAIEGERRGLVQNFLAKTFGDSGFDPKAESTRPVWYSILESIFDFYVGAVKKIILDPHRRYEGVAEWRRPDQMKRWTPTQVNRFMATPGDRRESAWLRVERIEAKTDTQENRFVLHTLRDIVSKLRTFAGAYQDVKGISNECLEGMKAQADELDRLAGHPFFKGVGRYTGGGAQSLVLQKRAGYAQILSVWLKLKQALSPESKGLDIGYRPLSALYEFWTFLTVRDLLRGEAWREGPTRGVLEGYECKEEPLIGSLEGLLDSDDEASDAGEKTLSRMGYVFTRGDVRVSLVYQQNYGTTGDEGLFAVVYNQRPDIVLSISNTTTEDVFTYLFDAKYRIEELQGKDASPRDAIDDMHRYRDAILYRRQRAGIKHEVIGAYVLYPGRLGSSYDYAPMREKENIGAFPLLPQRGHKDALGGFLKALMEKGTKKRHLENAIPPRGTEISFDSVVTDEMVLVVPNLSFERAKSFIDRRCYVCSRDSLHRSPESYRRIRFTHSGNADMFVDIVGCTVALKQHLGSFPGDQDYEPTDELVKFVLKS